MRALKFVLAFFALIVVAAVASVMLYFHSCTGRMQECYASFRSATSGLDRATQERFRLIHAGFTASEKLVAFPVPVDAEGDGIILVWPETDRTKLIATKGYFHWSPQLSEDGERLVFARMAAAGGERELVSCATGTWQCLVLFRTPHALGTPADVGNGYVLFAMNQPREGDSARSRRFDIFAVRKGEGPTRLTYYEMYGVQTLSVGNNRIVFGADGFRGFEPITCLHRDSMKCDKSEIYALDFDPQKMTVLNPPKLLKPLFSVAGYSVRPVVSRDEKRVSFLNTNRQGNPWRYNTAFADIGGIVEGGLPVEGYAFSVGAFVGDRLFVNEVFPDHYRVFRINLTSRKVDGFDVKHSPESIKALERVTLSFDGLASAD